MINPDGKMIDFEQRIDRHFEAIDQITILLAIIGVL